MLTVETYIDRSTIHGIGLFADQFVAREDIVWQFNPRVDLVYDEQSWLHLLENISKASLATLRRLSFKENGSFFLCIDNAQFMNHSPDLANVYQVHDKNIMRAGKDIHRGEELLCNYFEYSDCDDYHSQALKKMKSDNSKFK